MYGNDGEEGAAQSVGSFHLDWMRPDLFMSGGQLSGNQFGIFQFSGVELEPAFRGTIDEALGQRTHGIGKALYRHVATLAAPPDDMRFQEYGLPYYLAAHTNNLNETSRGMWDSLVRSGEASLFASGYYVYNTPTNGSAPTMTQEAA